MGDEMEKKGGKRATIQYTIVRNIESNKNNNIREMHHKAIVLKV